MFITLFCLVTLSFITAPIAGILAGILNYQTLGLLGGLIVGTASIGPSLFSSQATWQLFPTAIMSGKVEEPQTKSFFLCCVTKNSAEDWVPNGNMGAKGWVCVMYV